MPRFMDYLGPGPEPGHLEVRRPDPKRTEVFYVPSAEAVDAMQGAQIPNNVKLLDIDRSNQRLTIHPVNTRWKTETFLKPKYPQIRSLTLTGQYFVDLPYGDEESPRDEDGFPSDEDHVMMLLEDLPSSFIKDYEFGLGFSGDFKVLPPLVTQLTKASEILISDEHVTGMITDSDTFAISSQDFDGIRKILQRVARNGQDAMRTVKNASVHNVLAQKLGLPDMNIADGLSDARRIITRVANGEEPELSVADQSGLIDVVTRHTRSIVEEQPDEMVRLQRDVELVTLDHLITRFEAMIAKSLPEKQWQHFLNENRFLLSMTFGFPVIVVQQQASVGGHKLSGSGENITDFLTKNPLTNNVGIIEIKKPGSPLLYKGAYRGEVFAASKELSSAINQVINQKHDLVSRFAHKTVDSGIYDIASYAIKCCLIIGEIPKEERELRSFEYIRGNSKDVEIITFDEMLEKMKIINDSLGGKEHENN